VEEQRPPGFGSGVLPGVRNAARYEGTGARAADCDPIVDLEGELSAQNIDQLVAIVMEVKRRICASGCCFLERHEALRGFRVLQLECRRSAGRHVPHRTFTRLNNYSLGIHRHLLRLQSFYSAAALTAAAGSTLAAQNLYSGILPNGSSCGLVSTLAAASAEQNGVNTSPGAAALGCPSFSSIMPRRVVTRTGSPAAMPSRRNSAGARLATAPGSGSSGKLPRPAPPPVCQVSR